MLTRSSPNILCNVRGLSVWLSCSKHCSCQWKVWIPKAKLKIGGQEWDVLPSLELWNDATDSAAVSIGMSFDLMWGVKTVLTEEKLVFESLGLSDQPRSLGVWAWWAQLVLALWAQILNRFGPIGALNPMSIGQFADQPPSSKEVGLSNYVEATQRKC